MKYEELKDYDYDPDFPFQSRGRFYVADEVESAIAELKDENERLNRELEHVKNGDCINTCDVVEKHVKEEIKAKRALWLARAKAYRYIAELIACFNPDYVRNRKMFTPNNPKQKQMNSLKWAHLMLKIESKCRAKAEEYK